MKDAMVIIFAVVIGILAMALFAHFANAESMEQPAREWMIEQAKTAQTIPETPKCYQARTRPGRWDMVCISEAEWLRIHERETIAAQQEASKW